MSNPYLLELVENNALIEIADVVYLWCNVPDDERDSAHEIYHGVVLDDACLMEKYQNLREEYNQALHLILRAAERGELPVYQDDGQPERLPTFSANPSTWARTAAECKHSQTDVVEDRVDCGCWVRLGEFKGWIVRNHNGSRPKTLFPEDPAPSIAILRSQLAAAQAEIERLGEGADTPPPAADKINSRGLNNDRKLIGALFLLIKGDEEKFEAHQNYQGKSKWAILTEIANHFPAHELSAQSTQTKVDDGLKLLGRYKSDR